MRSPAKAMKLSSSASSSVDSDSEEDNTDHLLHGSIKTFPQAFSATFSLEALKEKTKETTNDKIAVLSDEVRALKEENARLKCDLQFCRGTVFLIFINMFYL